MFNEAFWFFYLVGVFEALSCDGIIALAVIVGLGSFVAKIVSHIEEDDCPPVIRKISSIGICVSILLFIVATFVPSKEAMYAGASQYVLETEEAQTTLRGLKDVIDNKIQEQLEDE